MDKKRVVIVSGSLGRGHDGVSRELARRLQVCGHEVVVRDQLQALPLPVRWLLRRGYVALINRAPVLFQVLFWSSQRSTWFISAALAALTALCRSKLLVWCEGVDLVISTFPLATQALGDLKRSGVDVPPLMTYLTDPAPHRLWFHPAIRTHACVSAVTATYAHADYGVRPRVIGPAVDDARWESPGPVRQLKARTALHLPTRGKLVLVLTGSLGLGDVVTCVEALRGRRDIHVAVLTGRNRRLLDLLSRYSDITTIGWCSDVGQFYAAADVAVHNAGGLTLLETVASGLPSVMYEPIPGHGRENARVLAEAGLTPWARDARQLIQYVLDPPDVRVWNDATAPELSLNQMLQECLDGE